MFAGKGETNLCLANWCGLHALAEEGCQVSRTGSITGQDVYFGVYLSASVGKQWQFGADGKGITALKGSIVRISGLTKLKEMVPGNKLRKSLPCPQGHFPRYKRFPCCICRAE